MEHLKDSQKHVNVAIPQDPEAEGKQARLGVGVRGGLILSGARTAGGAGGGSWHQGHMDLEVLATKLSDRQNNEGTGRGEGRHIFHSEI